MSASYYNTKLLPRAGYFAVWDTHPELGGDNKCYHYYPIRFERHGKLFVVTAYKGPHHDGIIILGNEQAAPITRRHLFKGVFPALLSAPVASLQPPAPEPVPESIPAKIVEPKVAKPKSASKAPVEVKKVDTGSIVAQGQAAYREEVSSALQRLREQYPELNGITPA